jgi:hypothetical protein
MNKKMKKLKDPKKAKKRNNSLSYQEFKILMTGLSDDEINLCCDLLSNPQQKL